MRGRVKDYCIVNKWMLSEYFANYTSDSAAAVQARERVSSES